MSQFTNTFVNGDTTLYNNHESENYTGYSASNSGLPFTYLNGALVISASPVPAGNQPYTSGLIETSQTYTQSGGYFEIRAMTPAAPGFWPAFWLLPYAYYPEIDILEQPNNSGSNTQYWTHTSTATDSSGGFTDTGVDVTQGYHRYGFLWTSSTIQYVFDGNLVGYQHPLPPSLVGLQMYLIANLAVGGEYSWPGVPPTGASTTYSIDYIRAFSNDPTVPAVSQQPISSPDGVDTTPVLMPPNPPTPAPNGLGLDALVLQVAEDPYQGDAQFTVSIDGHQRGGIFTAQANHLIGQTQAFTFKGNYGTAAHTVTVDFLNDAYGNDGDRNLYVTGATLNGVAISGSVLNEYSALPQSFRFTSRQVQPVNIGIGPDALLLTLNETPHTGNARFAIDVDGVQQGTVQVASAINAMGQVQTYAVNGTFGPAAHKVAVRFIDGAVAGSTTDPVDLFITGLSYDGVAVPQSQAAFTTKGTYTIAVPAHLPDTLSINMTEDSWLGDAQAEVTVDGKIVGLATVTAPNYFGTPQTITYTGNWGGGAVGHTVEVNFLNDAYAGPGQDRNLHVQAVTLDGASILPQTQHMMRGGAVDIVYPAATGAGWVLQ